MDHSYISKITENSTSENNLCEVKETYWKSSGKNIIIKWDEKKIKGTK
jgi:hypothetical protein